MIKVRWCVLLSLSALVGRVALCATPVVHAQLEEFDNDSVVVHEPIGANSIARAACARAKVLAANRDTLLKCRTGADKRIEQLVTSAAAMRDRFCSGETLPMSEPWVSAQLVEAEKKVDAASQLSRTLEARLMRADAERAQATAARDAATADAKASAERVLTEKQQLLEAIRVQQQQAASNLEEAKAQLAAAKKVRETSVDADNASREMDNAYSALIAAGSPQEFEAFLDDTTRGKACRVINDAMLAEYGKQTVQAEQTAMQNSRDAAHASDLMRKSSNTSSAITTALGQLETPGAPDAVAFAVMTALGAEMGTTGAQVVLTLNIAKLFAPAEAKRLKKDAAWRNLFLRAMLPLETTEGSSIAPGSEDPAEAAANNAEKVTRFQFVLGTSLFDSSDPRHKDNTNCYNSAMDYMPISPNEASDATNASVREAIFDTCHRRAAAQQRLALRAGIGFVSQTERTRTEVLAAAAVWAPVSQLIFNAIYQRVLEPEKADNFGFGVSLADNIGGPTSGVGAWARVGFDMLWIVTLPDDTDQPVLEARFLPKLLFKLGDSVASLGVGPRIARMEDDDRDVGVLAQLSLTYDADQLINPLLTQLPSTAAGGP